MRLIITLFFTVLGMPALAHVGHIGEAAGHDHWVAGITIGVIIAVGIGKALKGKGKAAEEADAAPEEETGEEQPA